MNLNDAWRSGHRWFRLAGTGQHVCPVSLKLANANDHGQLVPHQATFALSTISRSRRLSLWRFRQAM
jgi:hypothetical protein